MRDPKHPRQLAEEFRRRIVALVDSGRPRAEVMREYDLGKSTPDRWIRRVHARPHRRRGQPDARAEPPRRAGAGERPPQDGGRRPKASGAGIRMKVTAMAADARRHPASARCGIPGAPRSAYHRMPARPPRPKAPGPVGPDVLGAFGASRGGYGARRPKVALERAGITASGRRICRIMRGSGLSSARSGRAPRGGARPARPPSADSVLARGSDGRAPRTRAAAGPTYARAGGPRCCACLPVDPHSRETAGCSRGRREDARLAKAAFSDAAFPLTAIEAFHGDRGPESRSGEIGAPPSAFGVERSASRPGSPCDDAVVGSANRVLRRELVRGRAFASVERLRAEPFDWANWYNDCRPHSALGYMTPVGFREAGLTLS